MAPKKRSPPFNTLPSTQQLQPPVHIDPALQPDQHQPPSPVLPSKGKRRRQPRLSRPESTGITPLPSSTSPFVDPSLSSLQPADSPHHSSEGTGPESSSRRQSTSSTMRTSSIPVEGPSSQTPTGRISKAKKGKRVHACSFDGCGKIFTRAEHRRRHELNHNPEAMFPCNRPGCRKAFHRLDLLQRHQERHDLEHQLEAQSSHGRQLHQHGSHPDLMGAMPPSSMASPSTTQAGTRTSSGGMSIGSLVNHHTEYQRYTNLATPSYTGFSRPPLPYNGFISSDDSFYTPDRSLSPASEPYNRYNHRQSISSSSSGPAFDPTQGSPMVNGTQGWVPGSAPPNGMTNMFEDQSYLNSTADTSIPIPLTNLDGDEFDVIRRELSSAPGVIPVSNGRTVPDAVRWDCLEYYWQNFHPFFPIVHRPTFLPTKPSPLLASAMVAIGSQYDNRSDAKQYSLALLEVATRLLRRRDNINSRSRLADLQTVFLLEALSKYYSRRVEVEMSPRFRALFASLHQARRTLTGTSSLGVFRTLRPDRSKEELIKAHKFWVDHETRRRTLQAFAILDMQQMTFFEQPATILQHAHPRRLSTEAARVTTSLPCAQDLWETSPVEEWESLAKEQQANEGNSLAAGPQLQGKPKLDYFQAQAWLQNDSTALQQFDLGSGSQMLSAVEDGIARTAMEFNAHASTTTKSTPLKSLLIVSGESWIFGKKLDKEQEFQAAKKGLRQWVNLGNESLTALWHATTLLRSQITFSNSSGPTPGLQASFSTTKLSHESWCIYVAGLVCWAHGLQPSIANNNSGPASRAPSVMSAPTSSHSSSSSSSGHPSLMDSSDAAQDAQSYLQATDVSSPAELAQLDPATLGRIHGLLELVRMQKILPLLGGLMTEAERVLYRLVEGRSTLSHF